MSILITKNAFKTKKEKNNICNNVHAIHSQTHWTQIQSYKTYPQSTFHQHTPCRSLRMLTDFSVLINEMNKGWSADCSSAYVLGMPETGTGIPNWFKTQFPDSANIQNERWIMSVNVYETTEVGEAVLWGGRHGHDIKRKNLGI